MRRNDEKKTGSLAWMLRRDLFLGAVVLVIVFLLIPFNGINQAGPISDTIRLDPAGITPDIRLRYERHLSVEFMYIYPLNLEIVTAILLAVGFFSALVIFRHLFGKNQSQMVFALPVSREKDFFRRVLCGLTLCIAPVLLALAIYPLLLVFGGLGGYLNLNLYLNKALAVILLVMYGFSLGALSAVLCGTVWSAVLAGGVIGASVEGMLLIWNILSAYFLRTRIVDELYQPLKRFSPVICLYKSLYDPAAPIFTAGILGIAVLLILTFLVYRKRGAEMADRTLALNCIKIPLKVWLTLLGGSIVTFLAVKMLGTEASAFIAAALGCLAAWILTASLMEQSLKSVTRQWAIPLCCAAAMVLVLGGLHLDITGYDSYLPDPANVTAVEIRDLDEYPVRTVRLTGSDAIDGAMDWAAALRDRAEEINAVKTFDRPVEWSCVRFTYELANGRKEHRVYTHLTDNTAVMDGIRKLVESDDYRFSVQIPDNPGFYVSSRLNRLGLENEQFEKIFGFSSWFESPDEDQQKELLPKLRESYRLDCAGRTLETYQSAPMLEVTFYGSSEENTMLLVYPDDRRTAELLLGAEKAEKWIAYAKGGWVENDDILAFKVTYDMTSDSASYADRIVSCELAADAEQAAAWAASCESFGFGYSGFCQPAVTDSTALLVYSRGQVETYAQRRGITDVEWDRLPYNHDLVIGARLRFRKEFAPDAPTAMDAGTDGMSVMPVMREEGQYDRAGNG